MEDITPEREVRDYGTFGTELFNIIYDNSVHSSEHSSAEFLNTLMEHRDEFIDATDEVAVEDELDALNQAFVDIVPLYENMLYPGMLRKIAVVLDEVRQDRSAVEALAWLTISPNVVAQIEDANPFGLIFSYDDLAGLTDELLGLLIRNSTETHNATNQFLKEISLSMGSLEENTDEDSFVRTTIGKLTTPKSIYAPAMSYSPQTAVVLDAFGHPVLRDATRLGSDRNAMGYYVQSSGALLAPFEMTGVASGFNLGASGLLYQGEPVFETLDLQQTPLAYLLREGDALLEDDILDDALRATDTLLGDSVRYEDENGTYTGFAGDSAVVKLATSIVRTLDHDSVGPNFEAVIQVLENHRDVVARLIHDFDIILDILDETPSNFSGDNDLIDRLLPELLELAQEPGFFEDLMMALDDPRAAYIAPILAELAERRTTFIEVAKDSNYEVCFQACDGTYAVGTIERMNCVRACPRDEILGSEKADHSAPETLENRSLFQRTTNLMWETSELKYEVRAEKLYVGDSDVSALAQALGTLLSFDNLAEAYLKTITGDLHLIDHLSEKFSDLAGLIGDDGTTVATLLTHLTANLFDLKLSVDPTPAEVTRLFNKSEIATQSDSYRLELNVATCKSGSTCLKSNADALYAIESTGLIDALYPLVKVFNDHKKTAVLARMLSILFEYYPSGELTYYDAAGNALGYYPSDFRSFEPVLIRALKETEIVADFGDFGDALLAVELKDGTKLAARFETFVSYLLTPEKGLSDISGRDYVVDPFGNHISPISPAYLYIDALRDLFDFMDAHPETETQWEHALEGFADITIRTVKDADGVIAFEKPAGIQIVADMLSIFLKIFEDKTSDGTRSDWIRDEAVPEVQDFFRGRLLYAFFNLFEELDARPSGLARVRRFVLHLMESGNETPRHMTGAGYMLLSWMLENHHLTSLAHVLASPIDPDRVWTTEGFSELSFVLTILTCVDAFNECDPTSAFNHVFYRLFETDSRKRSNLLRLLDTGYDVLRVHPGDSAQRTVDDMQVFVDFAHDLFVDDDRGIERIYGLIDFTIWGNDRRPSDWKPEDASWQIQF